MFRRMRALQFPGGLVALAVTVCASMAHAQPRWEVEFHSGGSFAGGAIGGQTQLPEPGTPFATFVGTPSRRVSSWYFGDGAKLFNEFGAARGSGLAGLGGGLVPLDPVLNAVLAERRSGGSVGVRFGRVLNRRLTAELSVDYSRGPLEIGEDVAVAVEATRASFVTAWVGLLDRPGPFFTGLSVTSVTTVDSGSAHQMFVVGAIRFNLTQPGRFTPYATVGGGLLANVGDMPSVTVSGSYDFRYSPPSDIERAAPITERDTVTVRYAAPDGAPVGVFGAGFTYDVFQRSGARVDVRVHLSPSRGTTTVSARPDVVSQTPSILLAIIPPPAEHDSLEFNLTSPGIQFNNNTHPLSLHHSTLAGPDIVDFETFTSTGVQRQIGVTVGWYFRF